MEVFRLEGWVEGDVDAYIRRVGSRSPLQQGSGLLCNRAETERGGGGIRVG